MRLRSALLTILMGSTALVAADDMPPNADHIDSIVRQIEQMPRLPLIPIRDGIPTSKNRGDAEQIERVAEALAGEETATVREAFVRCLKGATGSSSEYELRVEQLFVLNRSLFVMPKLSASRPHAEHIASSYMGIHAEKLDDELRYQWPWHVDESGRLRLQIPHGIIYNGPTDEPMKVFDYCDEHLPRRLPQMPESE